MAWQKYITYREERDGVLKYFILQKEFPHNLACVCTLPNPEALAQGTIAGYNLWVVSSGVLRGNFVAVYPNYKEELQSVMDSMAIWYYNERILKEPKRYEKFKINNDVSTTGE